ncbi:MAG: methyltransferase domain-containing protein [Candidatus Dormibacteraeota bacterium]|uniref:Methyltransferase domain-containing protein n=1 Tax=Candidatus Amunia macphersoniae TaxID=3127014 RepID=A0A934KP72_9BACT|nr:methyltransferase domain-containing protein [Candidatus Dormibacteraeota bacterium]
MQHRIFAALYDRVTAPLENAGLAALRTELLGPLRGDVLEVGAGTGANLSHYGAVSSLVLVEPDPAMARRLRRRLARMGTAPAPEVRLGTIDGAIADRSKDAVVCTLVLCSAADPAALLSQARRVLRDDGALVLIEHVRAGGRVGSLLQTLLTPLQRVVAGGCHLNRRTKQAVATAGFDVSEVRELQIFSTLPLLASGIAGIARPTGPRG